MGNKPINGKNLVPALEKGLQALECVYSSTIPLSLTEISHACGRSVSEMQRVVPFIAEKGYFSRDERGLYRASSKLFCLGNLNPPFRDLIANALPRMREFSNATGLGIHLSVVEEDRLLILADVPGSSYLRLGVSVGSVHKAHESASGRLLLGFVDPVSFPAEAEMARQGHFYCASHLYQGVFDLAVPVRVVKDEAIAALATSWLQPLRGERIDHARILPLLEVCASGIAESFEPQLKPITNKL